MRKGKSLLGLRVISGAEGTDLGRVKDLVFDHEANQVLALLMSEKDLFGLIDAQIVPWEQVTSIGPDAITVQSRDSRVKAGSDERVQGIMHRDTALSGTRIYTTDGRDLGTLADTFIDENSGRIEGYEISGGFISDTMSGKKFLPAQYDLSVGRDVALVPPAAAESLQPQGGIQTNVQGAVHNVQTAAHSALQETQGAVTSTKENVSQSIFQVYDSAREVVGSTYDNIAEASVEKQKQWVVGKIAARDVVLPTAIDQASTPLAAEAPISGLSSAEIETPGTVAVNSDLTSSGEVISGEVLVREGETISSDHADRAAASGVLRALVAAAVAGSASEAYNTGRERIAGATHNSVERTAENNATLQEQWQTKAEQAALGKPAARDVLAADESLIIATGQIVTPEILSRARLHNREREVIASAGLGAISQTAQTAGVQVSEAATSLWEAARSKVSEWTQAAQDKKEEAEAQALQNRIDGALGRPVTRVILDRTDAVILNTGDIITNAAVERAREAGVLSTLLDSVHTATPEIKPDMMRADLPGEAALSSEINNKAGGASTLDSQAIYSDAIHGDTDAVQAAPVSVAPDGTKTYVLDETPNEAAERESNEESLVPSTSLISDESPSKDSALEAAMPRGDEALPRSSSAL